MTSAGSAGSSTAISLDGTWEFFPGDGDGAAFDARAAAPIRVPGLWEAQGYPALDGPAWYRRRFAIDGSDGFWTLRFGAVMDIADVFLNGSHLGSHDGGFTPFELDATAAVVRGDNVLAVRVFDPPLGDPEHARMPHGKQGWNNDAFPSRPSLYLTYGGIWQAVTLLRHGPVIARDVFVDGSPDDLRVSFELVNRAARHERAAITVGTLALERTLDVTLAPGELREIDVRFGAVAGERWTPARPVLHEVAIDVAGCARLTARYGLRTVRIAGGRILVNDEPYRMKSVLVQGFHPERLYAEGDRGEIVEEVAAAKAMGFNTVRLHIKAFDPAYLDVCDELGMLVQCDLPVAEPVEYEELAPGSALARRAAETAREQVRRDRNHPSIVLWSAMNEIGERELDVRYGRDYEGFVREVVGAIDEHDGTRPVIENDWVEFMGSTVYVSQILTAHWYGRLHRDYFDKVDRKLGRWLGDPRVLLVSEYGDWGLPEMPERADPPFWDARAKYAAAIAESLWPDPIERFLAETQRYQGWSDRLQAEAFRRHDRVSGYCLTELTDVPQELNGLLDIHRVPKPLAVAEVTRGNQTVLPMLDLRSFVVCAGEPVRAVLHVANDGAALDDVEIDANGVTLWHGALDAYRAQRIGDVDVAPAGEIVLRLQARGRAVAENRYVLRVIDPPQPVTDRVGLTVVAEDALDARLTGELRERLDAGEAVLILAQPAHVRRAYPVDLSIRPLDTRWGSSAFTFTTRRATFTAFPDCGVVVGEDATLHARGVVDRIEGRPYPHEPLIARYNPTGTAGTIVGTHRVGRGRLVFCQYRLANAARAGDLAAQALLSDLVRIAATAVW